MEEATYLEDFLATLEMIPNAVRRDCELIRELDREMIEISKELSELEFQFFSNALAIKEKREEIAAMPIPAVVAVVPTPSRKRGRNSINNASETITSVAVEENNEQKIVMENLIKRNHTIWNDMKLLKDRATQRMAEKSALAQNLLTLVEQHSNKLDGELAFFAAELKGGGEYEAPKGIAVDSEVAFYVDLHASEERSLFMGRVVAHRSEISSYDIVDIDDQTQRYTLPEHQVFQLGQADAQRKISKGDVLFALYPDSTSFYAATIVQAPKKSIIIDPTVMLQFVGDEDSTGKLKTLLCRCIYLILLHL